MVDYTKGGELPALKTCTKCADDFPRTAEFFQPYKGRTIDGLRPICRVCERKYDRLRKQEKRAAQRKAE